MRGDVMRVAKFDQKKGTLVLEIRKGKTAAYHRAGKPVGNINDDVHDLKCDALSGRWDVVKSSLMNAEAFPDTLTVMEPSERVPPMPPGPVLPGIGVWLIHRYVRDERWLVRLMRILFGGWHAF